MGAPKDYLLRQEMEKFIKEFADTLNTLSYIPRQVLTLEKVAVKINPLGDKARSILKKIEDIKK
jgi:hypothetical protein